MEPDKTMKWHLCLYASGDEEKTDKTARLLKEICDENLAGKCEIEVVDIMTNPQTAAKENIIATPCLIKKYPPPTKRLIGDLTDKKKNIKRTRDRRQWAIGNIDSTYC